MGPLVVSKKGSGDPKRSQKKTRRLTPLQTKIHRLKVLNSLHTNISTMSDTKMSEGSQVALAVPVIEPISAAQSAHQTPTPKKRRAKKTASNSKSATPSAVAMKREKSRSTTKLSQQPQLLSHPRINKLPPRPTKTVDDDGTELWCICNKPDNGTLMVGCDSCDWWFHTRCVKISEKHNKLISKFFCPYCELENKGTTLWKRKCRLQKCFEPIGGNDTKYCSKEHGIQFMRATLQQIKNRETLTKHDDTKEDEDDDDRQDLSKSQITQIINHTTSFEHFKNLGQTLPEAPIDISTDSRIIKHRATLAQATKQVEWLTKKKEMLNKTRENVKRINEEITHAMDTGTSKKKVKKVEICGFDPLLNEKAEFFQSFDQSGLGSANITALKDYFVKQYHHLPSQDDDGDIDMNDDFTPPICLLEKKKCSKHNGWQGMINDEVDMDARAVELDETRAEDGIQRVTKVLNVDYFEQQTHELIKKRLQV